MLLQRGTIFLIIKPLEMCARWKNWLIRQNEWAMLWCAHEMCICDLRPICNSTFHQLSSIFSLNCYIMDALVLRSRGLRAFKTEPHAILCRLIVVMNFKTSLTHITIASCYEIRASSHLNIGDIFLYKLLTRLRTLKRHFRWENHFGRYFWFWN